LAVRPVQSLIACTVQLYLYSPYWPYGLYRASVPVQGCPLPLPFSIEVSATLRDFRLPPGRKWDLRSFEILRGVHRHYVTDVSGQRICPIFKGQQIQGEWILHRLNWPLKMGTEFGPKRRQETYRSMLRKMPNERNLTHATSYLREMKVPGKTQHKTGSSRND